MMKQTTIFYYAGDAAGARKLAQAARDNHGVGLVRDASVFDGIAEPCSRVVILPEVRQHHRDKIGSSYPAAVCDDVAQPRLVPVAVSAEAEAEAVVVQPPRRRGRPRKVIQEGQA